MRAVLSTRLLNSASGIAATTWCFVLGPNRSGTTIVSRVLAESGAFVYLTAADIVARHPEAEEAGAALRRLVEARSTRRIDDVRISASLLEEYGFLLPDRRLSAASAPKVAAIHRELAAGRETARFLLRNPWDLPRAARVAALFPGACFVFVVRDPVQTLDSQLRAARTLLAGPSEYEALLNPRYRRLVRRRRLLALLRRLYSRGSVVDRLLRAFVRGTTRWIRDLDSLPDGCWTVTRYEDLLARPLEEITRLYGFLDLPPLEIPRLTGEIRSRGKPLDAHVAARVPKIRERTRLFRETFGY